MLRVAYIATDDFVKPKKLTESEMIRQAAKEMLVVVRFQDEQKAKEMFQEQIDRLELELQILQAELNLKTK